MTTRFLSLTTATLVALAGCGDSDSNSDPVSSSSSSFGSSSSSSSTPTLGEFAEASLALEVGSGASMQQQSLTVDDTLKELVLTRVNLSGSEYDGMLIPAYSVNLSFNTFVAATYFDTDNDAATGCTVGGIGAEYVIAITLLAKCNEQIGVFEYEYFTGTLADYEFVTDPETGESLKYFYSGNIYTDYLLAERNATAVVQIGKIDANNTDPAIFAFDAAYTSGSLTLETMPYVDTETTP